MARCGVGLDKRHSVVGLGERTPLMPGAFALMFFDCPPRWRYVCKSLRGDTAKLLRWSSHTAPVPLQIGHLGSGLALRKTKSRAPSVCSKRSHRAPANKPMQRIVRAIVILVCASALGGCVTSQGRPPSNHAYLDMYDRPSPKKRKANPTVSQSKPDEPTTVGSASGPAEYSPEWWAAERERDRLENERLKRVMQICHC
jgi:hypothetical protein